ncbi:glycosyltransferase family 2 protein [Lentisphaerota bacterium WC36G]|nr:glycosyltransferase family 2 protein [Lentisphaerae bacterium WC36]
MQLDVSVNKNELKEKLSVVIPVYNEEKTILKIVETVLQRPETAEVIIIDDASTDNTATKLKELESNQKVKLLYQKINCGKGAAITKGFKHATADYVIIQDADNEYNPDDYPLVLAPLVAKKAEVCYGSRFMGTPGVARYFAHEMGNKFLTLLSNIFTDVHLSDMETCYKAFRREVIQNINLESQRFGIEVEVTAKIAKSRCLRIYEVPISYNPRRYDEGKKITWKDGISAIYHIVKYNCFAKKSDFYRKSWNEVLIQK